MLKQAWRSYLASLHPRNYKYIKNGGPLGVWVYFLVISPIIGDASSGRDAAERMWFFAVNLTPFLIMWWSNLEHKITMPKQMYLLPMTVEQRAQYIRTLLSIKIGFPVIVGAVLHIIRGCVYQIHPLQILANIVAIISFGMGMYVCSSLRSKFDRYIRYAVRGKDGHGKDAWLNIMCMIFAGVYHFVVSLMHKAEVAEGSELGFIILAYIIPMVIMIIMDIAIIKTRYAKTVEDTCDYEENFNVLGKVKK